MAEPGDTGQEMKTIQPAKRGKRIKGLSRDMELLSLCLPVIAVLFLFNYLPMGGILLAFKSYKPLLGIWGSPWTGLQNFEFFVRSPLIWQVTRNTILYNLAFIVLTPLISVSFAVMLNEIGKRIVVKVYQTIFFLPYFLSWVVVSIMLYAFLNTENGLANRLIQSMGGESVSWYTRPELWPFILVFMGLWNQIGYNTVIYYAGLMGIDPTLYEAAAIDGAGRMGRLRHITLPMLTPLVVVMMILGIGRIFFADFGLHYQLPLQSGSLLPTVDVINYFTYRALMQLRDYGMGTAIGLYQSVMGLILVLTTNWAARKISSGEQGLF
jgi:putative aldouronate transport system permease protein